MRAVAELGKYLREKSGETFLTTLTEDAGVDNVLSVVLSEEGEGYVFDGVDVEEFNRGYRERYLYRKGAPNGPDILPASKITNAETTFKNKLLGWFSNNNLKRLKGVVEEDEFSKLTAMKRCIEGSRDEILRQIRDAHSDGKGTLLTIKVRSGGSTLYLGDIEMFKKILFARTMEKYYSKYGVQSIAKEKRCSVCGSIAQEVYGLTSDIFSFYNLDKFGFAPNMRQENGWRLYPVCSECALNLEAGKEFIESFNLRLSGLPYYLIPKFMLGLDERIVSMLKDYAKSPTLSRRSRRSETEYIGQLVDVEDALLRWLGEQENSMSLTFLFYKRDKSQLQILLGVPDVLPSRLKELYEKKMLIDKVIDDYFGESGVLGDNYHFTFGTLRAIFPNDKDGGSHDKYFLDTIDRIFTKRRASYPFLLSSLVRNIRRRFANGTNYGYTTLSGFLMLLYLLEVGVLDAGGSKMGVRGEMEMTVSSRRVSTAEDVFSRFSSFFNTDAKRAVFLEGVLTKLLLDIQRWRSQSTPFMKKLNGLKLDERKAKALFPQIQGKLEEYESNYYNDLESLASAYFLAAGDSWGMSSDEVSFCFALGMNMAHLFKSDEDESSDAANIEE